VLIVWLIGPALILTVFGILLFRRSRTLASALVALGFAAVFISGIANALVSYEVSHIYYGSGSASEKALTAVSVDLHGWFWLVARLFGPAGMWVASLSLLWHMLNTRGTASPNNRWRGP
jgi:hypothetical protein